MNYPFTIIDPDTGEDFTDALTMSEEEYAQFTQEEIAALQQERFQAWKLLISPSPVENNTNG